MPTDRVALLLRRLGERTVRHYRDPGVAAVVAFENSGTLFGPSVEHPHGQVFALPFVPHQLLPAAPGCPSCAALTCRYAREHQVAGTPAAVLSCPPYARFPYEMHVLPVAHAPTLADLTDRELREVAAQVHRGLTALERMGPGQPYMLCVYQAPRQRLGDYHLRLEILPVSKPGGGRKYLGGLELGFGVYVNPAIPAASAAALRDLLGRP